VRNTRFLGCQYPLVKTSRGILAQKNGVDQIKADLLQLLLTNPGERVMLPEYGTPLRKLLFEPNDEVLEMTAKIMIADSIKQWEPRIEIENIFVTSQIDDRDLNSEDTKENQGYILSIKILFFDPQDISEVHELKLEKSLGV
jgi:phage baseplate assembly protein W